MFPQKKNSTSSMWSPSTMAVSTLENTAPGMQKKQNQFSRVKLQTYRIQSTLKKTDVDEQGKKLCEREVERVEEEDKEEKI